jgi:hypothetical protein
MSDSPVDCLINLSSMKQALFLHFQHSSLNITIEVKDTAAEDAGLRFELAIEILLLQLLQFKVIADALVGHRKKEFYLFKNFKKTYVHTRNTTPPQNLMIWSGNGFVNSPAPNLMQIRVSVNILAVVILFLIPNDSEL